MTTWKGESTLGWRVKPVWSIRFSLHANPEHYATFHGFKSEEETKEHLLWLENKIDVAHLVLTITWKKTKMSRWMREERVIR